MKSKHFNHRISSFLFILVAINLIAEMSFAQIDSSRVHFEDGQPHCSNAEVLVRFYSDDLNISALENLSKKSGQPQDFINKSEVIALLNSAGGVVVLEKLFDNLRPSDTRNYIDEGRNIPLPELWAWFVVKYSGNVPSCDLADILNNMNTAKLFRYAEANLTITLPNRPMDSEVFLFEEPGPPVIKHKQNVCFDPIYYNPVDGYRQRDLDDDPNDHDINMKGAWAIEDGGSPLVHVGIISTGIDWRLSDFGGSIGYGLNKKVIQGYDFIENKLSTKVKFPIGSSGNYWATEGNSIAGMIGALRCNDLGTAGIAGGDMGVNNRGPRFRSFRVFDALNSAGGGGVGFISAVTRAISYASYNQSCDGKSLCTDILYHGWHLEYPYTTDPPELFLLNETIYFSYLINITNVSAQLINPPLFPPALNYPSDIGNKSQSEAYWKTGFPPEQFIYYPTDNYDISVGGSSYYDDELVEDKWSCEWQESGYGRNMDLIAPLSKDCGNTRLWTPWYYDYGTGNSYYHVYWNYNAIPFTPHPLDGTHAGSSKVAGVAALMQSYTRFRRPGTRIRLSPDDIENILESGTKEVGPNVGYDDKTGWGRLDAHTALTLLAPPFEVLHRDATYDASNATIDNSCVFYNTPFVKENFGGPLTDINYDFVAHRIVQNIPNTGIDANDIVGLAWERNGRARGWAAANILRIEDPVNGVSCTLSSGGIYQVMSNKILSFDHDNTKISTYVYEVYEAGTLGTPNPVFIGWFPCEPQQVHFAYSLAVQRVMSPPPVSGVEKNSITSSEIFVTNFPNPATDFTTIQYNLSKNGNISLELWNMLGQPVRVIESGYKKEGQYNLQINCSELPDGIYVFKLKTESGVIQNKLIIMH